METLKILQTISKIGKILSKIVYICCIVGIIGCLTGIAAMFVGGEAVKLGGVSLHTILERDAGIVPGTIWVAIGVGIILCAGELILARLACRYFDHELAAGTPFTLAGAKELMNLGITAIGLPLAAYVLAEIYQGILSNLMEGVRTLHLDGYVGLTLGLMLLVASLLCRYGAELTEK